MLVQEYSPASHAAGESGTLTRHLTLANGKESIASWDAFVTLWERANPVRAYCWTQQCAGEKALLNQFLVRLRCLYRVDFCFGALM